MRRLLSHMIISTLMLLFMSCQHKEIVSPGGETREVTVRFEWSHTKDASPEGMTIYFYPESDYSEIWRFDLAGREGGTVELPTGNYRVEAFNNDVPRIRFSGINSFESLKAETVKTTDSRDVFSTGILYGGIVSHLEVTKCGVRYINSEGEVKDCRNNLIRIFPDSLTTEYEVWIRDVEGGEGVTKVQASLNGIASEMMMASGTAIGAPATVTFPLEINNSGTLLKGSAGAFSPTGKDGNFNLSIAVTFSNGKTIYRKFDVTKQVLNSPFQRNVIIVIDGISIPSPADPDDDIGGIDVDVDGWTTFETDIIT